MTEEEGVSSIVFFVPFLAVFFRVSGRSERLNNSFDDCLADGRLFDDCLADERPFDDCLEDERVCRVNIFYL